MPEQLVIHKTVAFPQAEFDALVTKLEAWSADIPEPDAVTNDEMKKLSKMGDIKQADATLKLEALKRFNSFLPAELALALLIAKLASYKQAAALEKLLTVLVNKYWGHGNLAGIDLLKMLALVESEANNRAAFGNSDAINYLNVLDKIKADRAKTNAKAAKETPAAKVASN